MFGMLNAVEAMTTTPGEALEYGRFEGKALCSMPPFTWKVVSGEVGNETYVAATPGEVWRAKRRALMLRPESKRDKVIDEGRDRAVLFCATLEEARDLAYGQRLMCALSLKNGGTMRVEDNRTEAQKEKRRKELAREDSGERKGEMEEQEAEVGGDEVGGDLCSGSQMEERVGSGRGAWRV